MMDRFIGEDPLESLEPAITMEEIKYVQENYNEVHVSGEIRRYIVDLVNATRTNSEIELGCSPRATLNLMKGCQALAAIRERDYVILEDVKELAIPVMSHRIILKSEINSGSEKSERVIQSILATIETPIDRQ